MAKEKTESILVSLNPVVNLPDQDRVKEEGFKMPPANMADDEIKNSYLESDRVQGEQSDADRAPVEERIEEDLNNSHLESDRVAEPSNGDQVAVDEENWKMDPKADAIQQEPLERWLPRIRNQPEKVLALNKGLELGRLEPPPPQTLVGQQPDRNSLNVQTPLKEEMNESQDFV